MVQIVDDRHLAARKGATAEVGSETAAVRRVVAMRYTVAGERAPGSRLIRSLLRAEFPFAAAATEFAPNSKRSTEP